MSQYMVICPRCGGRCNRGTHVAGGAGNAWTCRKCGETCDDIEQAAPMFPRMDRAVGMVAIVLTVLTAAGGMLF